MFLINKISLFLGLRNNPTLELLGEAAWCCLLLILVSTAMSIFTKVFVSLVVILCFCFAVFGASLGAWSLAAMGVLVGAIVALFGLLPVFFKKYPLPERKAGEDLPSVFEIIKIYRQLYPGSPSWVAISVISLGFLGLILLAVNSLP